MNKIYTSAKQLIGNTPMLQLNQIKQKYNLQANIYAKLEMYNPAGSIKDRVAFAMIDDALKNGKLKQGGVIIEPTSGNTGIGLSSLGVAMGFRVIIVMPDSMSVERVMLMKAYGAEVVLTDGKLGMKGSIEKATQLANSIENSYVCDQFNNKANSMAHYQTTGPEIYNALNNVDLLVAGIGTGGTITGTGRYLKQQNPNVKVVGIEPYSSPFITQHVAGSHKIQGIGAGFIPSVLDLNVVDEVLTITNEQALATGKEFGGIEGLLIGISSGACLYGAIQLAKRQENYGKNIVCIFPDGGDHYLSSELYK